MIPTVAFIILAWNAEAYIENCLVSIFSLTVVRTRVYAVDNGSTDQTKKILEKFMALYPETFEMISFSTNRGTTVTRNIAMKKAKGAADWLCVLDSDTVINDRAVFRLIEVLTECDKAMLAIPRMWTADNTEQLSCKKFPSVLGKIYKGSPIASLRKRGDARECYPFFPDQNTKGSPPISSNNRVYPVDYGISACWLLRPEILEKVGYLDEKYFYAPEDVDYCLRVRQSGWRVLFVSDASIYHLTQRLSHKKIFSKMNVKHIQGLARFFTLHRKYLRRCRKIN